MKYTVESGEVKPIYLRLASVLLQGFLIDDLLLIHPNSVQCVSYYYYYIYSYQTKLAEGWHSTMQKCKYFYTSTQIMFIVCNVCVFWLIWLKQNEPIAIGHVVIIIGAGFGIICAQPSWPEDFSYKLDF